MNAASTSSLDINFENTEIAFKSKDKNALIKSYWLFKAIGYNWLVKLGPGLVETAFKLKLPIEGIIKKTVFSQFCGGESMHECNATMDELYNYGVGTILDYSVEGEQIEANFDATTNETIDTIKKAFNNPKIPFCVFKVTGLGRFDLLAKINANEPLTATEESEYARVKNRVYTICKTAHQNKVRIFIDAEESWIQDSIDGLCTEMMEEFNKEQCIVYNTLQLYRHDRFEFLKESITKAKQNGYNYGVKLVRGAYMEKERERAKTMGYDSPIQPTKSASDTDYNKALEYALANIDVVSICAGTHNEQSSLLLTQMMHQKGIAKTDTRIYFSQLFGMSDHLSFNLSNSGYNVAKYLPYGPVKSVLPYLFRRAAENTSVKGQAGRELNLISKEMQRRKSNTN